jgi:hypothetical protein
LPDYEIVAKGYPVREPRAQGMNVVVVGLEDEIADFVGHCDPPPPSTLYTQKLEEHCERGTLVAGR